MPQLDLGIYFIQIFINFFFFWFLYFYIKFFILGKLSNIIKIKNFFYVNNNYIYSDNSVFHNQIELSYYKSNLWNNFHNFKIFFNFIKNKNVKIFIFLSLQNIYILINFFFLSIFFKKNIERLIKINTLYNN